jgi:hypothetical protein
MSDKGNRVSVLRVIFESKLSKLLVSTMLLAALNIFASGVIPAIAAPNVCTGIDVYNSSSCTLDTAAGSSFLSPNLKMCDDGYGYHGYDYLSHITFKTVQKDGVIGKGQNLPFEAQINQSCLAWNNAYAINVSLISPSGKVYAGSTSTSSFTYSDKYSAPLLSYCSTEICGWARIQGSVQLPSDAPGGQYIVSIHIVSNWPSYSKDLSFNMSTTLGMPLSASDIPTIQTLAIAHGSTGPVVCYFTEFTPAGVASFGITGSDWSISEDGSVIDTYENLPLSNSDKLVFYTLNHGIISVGMNTAAGTRLYSYTVTDQKKDSKYACRVAINTNTGAGTPAEVSALAPVSTKHLDILTDGSESAAPSPAPSATATATPTKSPAKSLLKTIYCLKGRTLKIVKSASPRCPSGYHALKSH